jgi:3-hydroxyisobutyrate dehydrogenase
MSTRIGFIGLGIMGRGMAANLLKAGFSPHRLEPHHCAAVAMSWSPRARSAAPARPTWPHSSDIIVICVSDTPDVEAVILGEQGVIHGARPGSAGGRSQHHQPAGHQEIASGAG